MNIKEIYTYITDVGPFIFISKSIRKAFYAYDSKISWWVNNLNEKYIANYLRNEIKKSNIDFASLLGSPKVSIPTNCIFIMWWQGEENAPALVKTCIKSIRVHANNHKVIVISKDNINQFIDIPEFISSKVKKGKISFTHLSDIIRLSLLTLYGGAWIDATVFCSKEIPEEAFKKPFYSIHFGKNTKDPSHGRWTTFLLFAHKDNQIVKTTLEYHYKYWNRHHIIVDYIMFDYFINEVSNQNKISKKMIDDIPIGNKDVFELLEYLEDTNIEIKDYLNNSDTIFFKLSWKYKFKNTKKVISVLNDILNKEIHQ